MTAVNEDFYDDGYVFGADQGLKIAVFVLDPFDSSTYHTIDPTYGRIRFQKYGWKLKETGKFQLSIKELESHVCSKEELLGSDTDSFWPIRNASEE